jgi:transcriptional regulator with XRE-family HTH domain
MERNEELLRKFGKHLAALRKKKGLSVGELALAAQMEPVRLHKIEAGEVNLLLSTIVALAVGLEIPPEELLKAL